MREPVVYNFGDVRAMPTDFQNVHESVFRASGIIKVVFELLARRTDHQTIIDIMNDLHANDRNRNA